MIQPRAGSVGVYQHANSSNHILEVEHKYRYYCQETTNILALAKTTQNNLTILKKEKKKAFLKGDTAM